MQRPLLELEVIQHIFDGSGSARLVQVAHKVLEAVVRGRTFPQALDELVVALGATDELKGLGRPLLAL